MSVLAIAGVVLVAIWVLEALLFVLSYRTVPHERRGAR